MVSELKKIGIFGGTFNPFHLGHEAIVREALNPKFGLEQIIVSPCAASPHKLNRTSELMPDNLRVQLIEIALKDLDKEKVVISRWEIDSPPPSFTIKKLEWFKKNYPNKRATLIMGYDQFATLPTWFEYDKWKNDVDYLVFMRGKEQTPKQSAANIKFADLNNKEVSSTIIRNLGVKNSKHLLNKDVYNYLMEIKNKEAERENKNR